ncbi:MAG: helix-turn-helix domain-containing protein [Myxococcota bacterium]
MNNPLTPRRSPKPRYHHGDLQKAALRRGREIVALRGPDALTLRGLARELGVTATALVYYFGSRGGLRSAVAAAVLADLEKEAFAGAIGAARTSPEVVGSAWVAYAEKNPYLYRLASGEGWRDQPRVPNGLDAGGLAVPSPRRVLQTAFARRTRRFGLPAGDAARADLCAFTIHGLALARMDGAGRDAVAHALGRLAPDSPGTAPTA